MEFMEDFAIIQGTLLSLQRKYGTLENLSLQAPDDVKTIGAVVDLLKDKICDSKFTDCSEEVIVQRLRRINLFFILNTNLNIQDELMEDLNCGHLVRCAPTLSKDLLLELTWELALQKYMIEAIAFSPPVLSSELLDIVITKINSMTYFFAFPWIVECFRVLYCKMYTLQETKKKESNLSHINSKLFAHYKVLLGKISNSESNKLKGMDVKTLYCHAGNLTHKLLLLLNTCLQNGLHPEEEHTEVVEMYNISLKFDYTCWNRCQITNGKQFITALNNELFSAIVRNLNHITVGLWLYWVEYDSVNGDKERSLQSDIAETMFICLDTIKEVQASGMDSVWFKELIPMLSSMAVKPRNEDDEIRDADINDILKNISNKNKTQSKWFKALLRFDNGNAFYNKDCLKCIKNNLCLVTFDDVDVICGHVIHMLDSETDLNDTLMENLKTITFGAIKNVPLASQLEVMNNYLTKANIRPVLRTKDFNTNMTEVFNKAISISDELEDKFISDFICLSFQSPKEVVMKMLLEGLANTKQGTLMVNVLKVLRPLNELPSCDCFQGSNLVVHLLRDIMMQQDWTDAEETNFIHLVVSLVNESVVDREMFTNTCLFPVLHTSLVNKTWYKLSLWLHTLHVFVDGTVEGDSTLDKAVMLVLVAQVLEVSRQNLFTFSAKAVLVCEESLVLIRILLEAFLNERTKPDKQVQWLQIMLESLLSPSHLFYYWDLWYKFEAKLPITIDLEILLLHGTSLEQSNSKSLTETGDMENTRIAVLTALVQMLPSCTQGEWNNIANSIKNSIAALHENPALFMFDVFADALLLLSTVVGRAFSEETTGHECAASCLDFCVRNFGSLIKDCVLSRQKLMPALSGVIMFQKCAHILERLPHPVKDSCSVAFLNIFVDIMTFAVDGIDLTIDAVLKEKRDKKYDLLRASVMKDLRASIDAMQDKDTRHALSVRLMDITTTLGH